MIGWGQDMHSLTSVRLYGDKYLMLDKSWLWVIDNCLPRAESCGQQCTAEQVVQTDTVKQSVLPHVCSLGGASIQTLVLSALKQMLACSDSALASNQNKLDQPWYRSDCVDQWDCLMF